MRSRGEALVGILNGVDPRVWDPGRDPALPQTYGIADAPAGKRAAKSALQARFGLPPPERRCTDLAGIGRADRRQPIGIEQARLQKRNIAVELDPVDREKVGGERQLGKNPAREEAAIGEVVDREHARDCAARRRHGGEIGGSEPGMPIVAVHDIGTPERVGAARGVIRLGLVQNLLDLENAPNYWIDAIDGGVILYALILARIIGGEAAAE